MVGKIRCGPAKGIVAGIQVRELCSFIQANVDGTIGAILKRGKTPCCVLSGGPI